MIKNLVFSFCLLYMPFVSIDAEAAELKPLTVTIDKVNATLDWSAMPPARSYTLYYALGDCFGELIPTTIGSVEMGARQILYVPGLPSGLVIFAAVLAHTDSGDVGSNIETFAGFAGTVSIPESGDVLLMVKDPGGLGEWDVYGSRIDQNGIFQISRVSIDSGDGPLVMQIVDDRPSTIIEGTRSTEIVYRDGRPVNLTAAITREFSASGASGINRDDLCLTYQDRESYEKILRTGNKITGPAQDRFRQVAERAGISRKLVKFYSWSSSIEDASVAAVMTVALSSYQNLTDKNRNELAVILAKLKGYYQLVFEAMDGMYDEVVRQMLSEYDEQCGHDTGPGIYVHLPEGDMFLNTACTIPPGAQFFKGSTIEYYTLNYKTVGPYNSWLTADHSHRFKTLCYDDNGVKQGWFIEYNRNDDDKVRTAIKNFNGQNILEYEFYDSGNCNLSYKIVRDQGGSIIESFHYGEAGTLLRHCDQQGCTDY